MAHPGKVETGHKWTTWDVKWDNYIGSMVVVLDIPLDYVMIHDIPVECTVANEHYRLKYQVIHIVPDWEAGKMDVYTKLKACCLYGKVWSLIKSYDAHNDG